MDLEIIMLSKVRTRKIHVTYMWNLIKKIQMNLFIKQKQTDLKIKFMSPSFSWTTIPASLGTTNECHHILRFSKKCSNIHRGIQLLDSCKWGDIWGIPLARFRHGLAVLPVQLEIRIIGTLKSSQIPVRFQADSRNPDPIQKTHPSHSFPLEPHSVPKSVCVRVLPNP